MDANSGDDVKVLLDKLNEKENLIKQVEKEIKKLTKSKQEILKIVQERDEKLANDLLEIIPEIIQIFCLIMYLIQS